jgi:hypothetical protein
LITDEYLVPIVDLKLPLPSLYEITANVTGATIALLPAHLVTILREEYF